MSTNRILPSGLKLGPASSARLRRLTANCRLKRVGFASSRHLRVACGHARSSAGSRRELCACADGRVSGHENQPRKVAVRP
jgi:hypothetical protein